MIELSQQIEAYCLFLMLQSNFGFQYLILLCPNYCLLKGGKSQGQGRKIFKVSCALPETAASVAIAATVVGAAATILVRRNTKASQATQVSN